MDRDPGELRAEFEAECQRVGVRVQDVMLPLDTAGMAAPGSRDAERDIVVALDCLRRLPNDAGASAFQRWMNISRLTAIGGYRSLYRDVPLRPMTIAQAEGDSSQHIPSMREIERHEEYLLAFVTSLAGDAGTRDRALQRRGVYKEYAKVVTAYLDLVGDGVEGVEALRRVAFLLWCSATQPACLTGVGELTDSQEREIIALLDEACAEGELDPQLRWMLGYYHGACPELFNRYTQLRALQGVLARTFPESWRAAEPEVRHFAGRGLMGRVWSQIISAD